MIDNHSYSSLICYYFNTLYLLFRVTSLYSSFLGLLYFCWELLSVSLVMEN